SFREKGGRDLVALAGVWNPPGAIARLDSLRFNYPGASETLVLLRPVSLSGPAGRGSLDSPRLSLDSLELGLGRTTVSLKGDVKPLGLALEIREAPFSLVKGFRGPELPEGELSSLTARLGPDGSGSFDLKAFVLLATETGRKLRFGAEAKGALEGGRALAGEIDVTLPERPRGRARAPQATRQAGGGAGPQAPRDAPGGPAPEDGADPASGDPPDGGGDPPGRAPAGAAEVTAAARAGGGDPAGRVPGAGPVHVKYRLPFSRQGDLPVPDLNGPVQAELAWTGRIESLWGYLGLAERFLTGSVEVDARLHGTLKRLQAGGSVYVANGTYEDRVAGISLTDISLEGRVSDNTNDISVLAEASDGNRGTVALEGKLRLDSAPALDARAQLRHLAPLHRDDFSLTASGLVRIAGPLTALRISSKALVESLEVNIQSAGGGRSVRTLDIDTGVMTRSPGPELDISVSIPRGAYVRGRGLDSEWAGDLHIGGTASMPLFSGNLKPVRGYFTFLSRDFQFSGGGISFRNNRRLNPGLDIELMRSVPDLTAYLRIRGTLSRPQIRFESQPPYPEDEVLSRVLFDKDTSELSRMEALQLANSLMEMTGLGPRISNPLVTMRDALGLSVLRVGDTSGRRDDRHLQGTGFRDNLDLGDDDDSDSEIASTLEAGKYISDNIYVGVEQNLADNTTGVRVDVELAPNVNLTSRSTSTSSRVALGWKHDY
ncbi:MAG: translocation/assembly module TamB, partial [Deltaproteobacteria bacterium]|nr:translocation/assembly module TamB [Deltaproteobacteria bacterium]